MTSSVQRPVPLPALVHLGNPMVRMILGSPLHGMLDDSLLVLHLTGRDTGRRYDIPVPYVDMDMDGEISIATVAPWRVNVRGGADVEVTLRGGLHPMRALLTEDPAAVAVSYQAMIDRIGWKKAQRRLPSRCPAAECPLCWNSSKRPSCTAGRSSPSLRSDVAAEQAAAKAGPSAIAEINVGVDS